MKTILPSAVSLLLSACATPEQEQRHDLTDRIEERVILPEAALPLSWYARHYAFDKNGLVIGVYSRGFEWPDPDDVCAELLRDLTTRQIPCPSDATDQDRTLAGQRQWVEDTDHLPLIYDGGCSVVTIIYDPKADVVKDTYCNGHA